MKWTKDRLQQHLLMLSMEMTEMQRTLEHRDSILSIMYDLVRSENSIYEYIIEMIKAVIDEEVWAELTERQRKLVKAFWNREF